MILLVFPSMGDLASHWRVKATYCQLGILAILANMHVYLLIPNIRMIMESFETSYTYVGILMGIYIFMSGIAALAWSIYSDMTGLSRKVLMTISIAGGGFFSIVSSLTPNKYVFASFFILAGMSLSAIKPLSTTIIVDIFKSYERSQRLMQFRIISGLGVAFGFAIGVILGAYVDWRYPIIITGALYLAVGTPLSAIIIEPPKGLSERQLYDILRKTPYYPFSLKPKDFRSIAETKSNRYLMLQGIFGVIAGGSIEVWMLQYLVSEAGANELTASVFMGLGAIGTFGGIVIAWVADSLYRKSPRFRPLIAGISSFLTGIFFVFLLYMPINIGVRVGNILDAIVMLVRQVAAGGVLAWAVLFFFLGMLFNGSIGSIRDSVISDVNLPEHRATVISAINIVELFSKSLGIAIIGALIDFLGNIRYPLMVSVSLWMVSGIAWMFVARHVERDSWKVDIVLYERRRFLGSIGGKKHNI